MGVKSCEKVAPEFSCIFCDYVTSRKSSYDKHLLTAKHCHRTNLNKKNVESGETEIFTCKKCKKIYKARNSLWYHNQKCLKPLQKSDEELKSLSELVIELVKSNADLQKQMLEVCKSQQHTTNINNHSNSHNKTFNLQFFLNETCKDAMNIMDFVDSFTLQLSDLEDVSKQGYVDGISNIIMKKLNELDVHKRPIHCSDAKREIMYVKDQNKWEKEDLGYAKLRKAIKYISKKNSDLLGQWSEAHPASKNITTQTNTEYMQMIVQAMGGRGEIGENESKIIKKIAKTVLIEKI
jgi:hypothetical protein